MQDRWPGPIRRATTDARRVSVTYTDPGAGARGRCYACNHWYSWFYDMRTTRVVWARSVALPDRLLVQARAGELVDLRESCLWQRRARRVRSGGVVGWSRLAGGRWAAASCSTYLSTRSTNVSTVCLTLGGRQLLGESEPNEVLELAHSSASRACRAEGWQGWRRGFLIKHAASEARP